MKCPNAPCSECAEICPNRTGGHWGREEAVLLISLWPYETPEQIGNRMGRSADACAAKYRSMRNVTYAGRNQTVQSVLL